MKKLIAYFLCTLMLLPIFGCVNPSKEATSTSTSLVIYYPKNNNLYTHGIQEFMNLNPNITVTVTEFPTALKMDEQIKADMETGIMPDVMLFDENTLLNIPQMAADGVFAMVDEYMAEDAIFQSVKDQYLSPAMESGKFLGKQMILPFSFKLPCLFGNVDKVSELALYNENYTLDELFELLKYNIEKIKDYSENCTIFQLDQDIILELMLRVSGEQIVDYVANDISIDPGVIEKITDYAKIIFDEQAKAMTIARRFNNDVPSFIPHSMFFLWSGVNLPYDAWTLQTLYRISEMANLKIYLLPLMKSSETVNATVSQFGVVSSNGINRSGSYQFLRFIMDYNGAFKEGEVFGMQVNMKLFSQNLETLTEKSLEIVMNGAKVQFVPLAFEYKSYIEDLMRKIGQCKLPEAKVETLFKKAFQPYVTRGESSDVLFEDCYANFVQSVDEYLQEPTNYKQGK